MTDYSLLLAQARSLTEDIPYLSANLANLSALLYESLGDVNWVGFYEVMGDKLVLGPFQGRPACVILPIGKGVCAACAREKRSVNVPDVHSFSGHIACDSASASELVLPVFASDGSVRYVLDIDSPVRDRFTAEDEEGLKRIADFISSAPWLA